MEKRKLNVQGFGRCSEWGACDRAEIADHRTALAPGFLLFEEHYAVGRLEMLAKSPRISTAKIGGV